MKEEEEDDTAASCNNLPPFPSCCPGLKHRLFSADNLPLLPPHAHANESTQSNKAKRQVVFKRAEQYVNEYRKKEREEIRLRRVAKSSGEFYVPAQPKVYFVVRIKG